MKGNFLASPRAASSVNPTILVEGEIGYIGSSSAILQKRPEESLHLTTSAEASQFVKETGVDVLSPAVGNMHGLLREPVTGEVHKHFDITRIKEIKGAARTYMTLRGGSGTADADFVTAIKSSMNIIHSIRSFGWRGEGGLKTGCKTIPMKLRPIRYCQQRIKTYSKS